jgi:signal transduction histidine kinase
MNESKEKTRRSLIKTEIFVLVGFFISIIILAISLLISDFNILKFINFLVLILIGISLFFYFKILRKPKERKLTVFEIVREVFDSLKEAIVIYDEDFKIVFANQTFFNLVGLEKEDLINLTIQPSMIKSEKYEMLANVFFPFIQGQNLKIINKNPETIDVKFDSPQEKYLLIVYLDVYIDRKLKLRIVIDKTEDVINTEKKVEFAQLLSHHLLTPLTEIRWNLESIDTDKLTDEDKNFLNNALKSIKNALILSESFLNLARLEFGRLEVSLKEIDFEKLLVEILDILKEKIEEKKLKITIKIQEEANIFKGDESILKIALFSIIENAVIYNKNGGEIKIEINKLETRPYIEIIIEDTGFGMSEEDVKNLFKKYYRGKKAKELQAQGFGIGLYNAKSLINLHGGEINIESKENIGTKVFVYLPTNL